MPANVDRFVIGFWIADIDKAKPVPSYLGDGFPSFNQVAESTYPPLELPLYDLTGPIFDVIDELMKESYPTIPHGPIYIPWSATDARFFRIRGIPGHVGPAPYQPLNEEKRAEFAAHPVVEKFLAEA